MRRQREGALGRFLTFIFEPVLKLSRYKLCFSDAEFLVLRKEGKRGNPLWIASFSNEAQDKKGKSERASYFGTVPKSIDIRIHDILKFKLHFERTRIYGQERVERYARMNSFQICANA